MKIMCTSGWFQKNLVLDDGIVSQKQLLSELGSFRLSQASTEGLALESLALLTPSTSKGGTAVEQLCHKEFAKYDSPLPLLLAMYSQGFRCICFVSRLESLARKFGADLGHKIIVQRQSNRNYKDELKLSNLLQVPTHSRPRLPLSKTHPMSLSTFLKTISWPSWLWRCVLEMAVVGPES